MIDKYDKSIDDAAMCARDQRIVNTYKMFARMEEFKEQIRLVESLRQKVDFLEKRIEKLLSRDLESTIK